MVKIGKFFKRKGGHNDGLDEKDGEVGSVMCKGTQIEKTGDVPVDAADNERSDRSARKSFSTEKSEQREEAPETSPFDLDPLSASESDSLRDASPCEDINTMDDDIMKLNTVLSDKSFMTMAMENKVTAKYFHKDVVVNCLDEGARDLVIRAMYCIPKPNAEDHVVVKVEVSIQFKKLKATLQLVSLILMPPWFVACRLVPSLLEMS